MLTCRLRHDDWMARFSGKQDVGDARRQAGSLVTGRVGADDRSLRAIEATGAWVQRMKVSCLNSVAESALPSRCTEKFLYSYTLFSPPWTPRTDAPRASNTGEANNSLYTQEMATHGRTV